MIFVLSLKRLSIKLFYVSVKMWCDMQITQNFWDMPKIYPKNGLFFGLILQHRFSIACQGYLPILLYKNEFSTGLTGVGRDFFLETLDFFI